MAADSALWQEVIETVALAPRELVQSAWQDWLKQEAPRFSRLGLGRRCAFDLSVKRPPRIMPQDDAPYQDPEVAAAYCAALVRTFRSRQSRHPFSEQQRRPELLSYRAPLYWCGKRVTGDLAYVDLRWAYWQIYSRATLDLIYDPSSGRATRGRIPFADCDDLSLVEHPLRRNAVVSRVHPARGSVLIHGLRHSTAATTFWSQPCLWAYVMDVLCAVSQDVRDRFQCFEVATDGYLVRAEQAPEVIWFLQREWGLDSRVKAEGGGEARGLHAFRCADMVRGQADGPALPAVDRGRLVPPPVRAALRRGRLAWQELAPRCSEAQGRTPQLSTGL